MSPLPSITIIDKSSHWVETRNQGSDCVKVGVVITLKEGERPDDTVMGKPSFDQVK